MSEDKWCGHCRAWKAFGEFGPNRSRADGLHPWCLECVHAYNHEHREMRNAQIARFRAAHLEQERERQRIYQKTRRAGLQATRDGAA